MKETPILFNGSMVRALMEGRKTQTRRLVKLKPGEHVNRFFKDEGNAVIHVQSPDDEICTSVPCPFGITNDILWVKETFGPCDGGYCYRASEIVGVKPDSEHWKPSIFMNRDASRINLFINEVRVEPLQNLSVEDAIAEGLKSMSKDGMNYKWGIPDRDGLPGEDDDGWPWKEWCADPRDAYRKLWDSINGKTHPWSSNPWVWVIGFPKAVVK